MSTMPGFPKRPLKKPLDINSSADPEDVLDVKIFLHQNGFYQTPKYGITPYPDEEMFKGIKKYQAAKGLTVDGIMRANGETQESMRLEKIEKEEVKPPVVMIPGTNIPDRSIPEEGLDLKSYEWYWNQIKDFLLKNDPGIITSIPDPTMDPHIFVPPANPNDPNRAPKQLPKRNPKGT